MQELQVLQMSQDQLVTITLQDYSRYLSEMKQCQSLREENRQLKEKEETGIKAQCIQIHNLMDDLKKERKDRVYLSKKILSLSRALLKKEDLISQLQEEFKIASLNQQKQFQTLRKEEIGLFQERNNQLEAQMEVMKSQNLLKCEKITELERLNDSLKEQNQSLQSIADELNNNEGLIMVYRCQAQQLENKKEEQKQAIQLLEEEILNLQRQLKIREKSPMELDKIIFQSRYFVEEMRDEKKVLKTCETMVKLHFLSICKQVSIVEDYKQRETAFKVKLQRFLRLLFQTLTVKHFMNLMV